jgi:hypothetical protein
MLHRFEPVDRFVEVAREIEGKTSSSFEAAHSSESGQVHALIATRSSMR